MNKKVISLFLFLTTLQIHASEFELVGSYLLEYSVFKIDVYQVSYFKKENTQKLVLDYKIAVKREHSIEGWKVGLKHKLSEKIYQEKAKWLFDHTFDVEKGDTLSIIKSNELVEIYKNEKLVGKISDTIVAELALEPWLGDRPVDKDLKASLLGVK